jgi:pimeloyl-ACP methyl ester carboxylesterase
MIQQKEKIYLIPGLMTDHRLWHRLEPHLDEYELIHTPIPHSDDFDEIVEHLDSTIECEKINLLGFSLGGYIASYFAIKYPSKVQRLFLVGSTPSATEQKDIGYRTQKLDEAKKSPFKPLGIEKARELLERPDDNELAHTMVNMFNDLGHNSFISQLSSTLNRVDLFGHLVNLTVPIKFFYSTKDRLLNRNSIENIMNQEHNFQLVERNGTSHNIPLEVPYHLSLEIKDWMK